MNNPVKYTDPTGHDVNFSGMDVQCRKETQKEEWFAYLERLRNDSSTASVPLSGGSVRSVGTGWAVGNPVNQLNSDGSYPNDTQVLARYWQNRAFNAAPGEFSESNLAAMRAGYGPNIRVWVQSNKTGAVSNERFVKEIHHIDGRAIEDPHNPSNLMEAWPWEHTAIDSQRNWGYTLLDNPPLGINEDPAQCPIEPLGGE